MRVGVEEREREREIIEQPPPPFHPSPISHERASFGIRGGVETRTDSQSLAVRSTTWLESAIQRSEEGEDDDENDEDDDDENDENDENDEDDDHDDDVAPRPSSSIMANVVHQLGVERIL